MVALERKSDRTLCFIDLLLCCHLKTLVSCITHNAIRLPVDRGAWLVFNSGHSESAVLLNSDQEKQRKLQLGQTVWKVSCARSLARDVMAT